MKTLIDKQLRISRYIFTDDMEVIVTPHGVSVPSQNMEITDMNSSNAELINVLTVPDDWDGLSYMFTYEWVKLTGMENILFEDAIVILNNRLVNLRRDLSALINECKLINDPAPPELEELIAMTRYMYNRGKQEIAALTEETYKSYVLVGPEVNQLITALKSFL